MTTGYEGRSLAYVRQLLDCPPKWPSAQAAADELAGQLRTDEPIPLGAVCFYTMPPWGDVGVHVGVGEVLRMAAGRPVLRNINVSPSFQGWILGGRFRDAARNQNPLAP